MESPEIQVACGSHKRRWHQFSLRTLLVVMLLASIGMSWLAVKLNEARRQRTAVEEIQRSGGIVLYESHPGPRLQGTLAEHLFARVDGVWFGETGDADSGLVHLKRLPHVRDLRLSRSQMTDAGLVHVKEMTHLKTLYLDGTRVTDAGLEELKGLGELQELRLFGCRVHDSGLKHLGGMKHLQMLELRGTFITDAGLEHLKGLTELRALCLEGTRVTRQGVWSLRRALPNCEIER